MLGLILVGTLLTTALLVIGLYDLVTAEKRLVGDRLSKYTAADTFSRPETGETGGRRLSPSSLFRRASRIFAARGYAARLEQELIRADLPLKGEEYILLNILTAVVPALLSLLLLANAGLALVLCVLGAVAPRLVLGMAQQRRLSQFNSQIGDSLVIMANALRAGFSFFQAIEIVGREMPAPIATEFNRTLREMNLGTPLDEALLNLTRRVPSEDLDLVVTAVLIQRHVGGNLAEVLDSISRTIRERVRIQGEIKTLTAQGRVSGMIIGLLPVVVAAFMMVVNPTYIGVLFHTTIGWIMIGMAVVSEVLGLFLIRRIISIEI